MRHMPRGFSLPEVLVAMALLTTMTAGVAQMMMLATARDLAARHQVLTSALAIEKMEQIRSLTFAYDANGVPTTDFTTNLASCAPDASGTGLGASPSNALDADYAGFVDYLDAHGACLAGGSPSAVATYTRRWAIVPLESDPSNGLVVSVLVTLTASEQRRPPGSSRQRRPEDALFVTMRTRSAMGEE